MKAGVLFKYHIRSAKNQIPSFGRRYLPNFMKKILRKLMDPLFKYPKLYLILSDLNNVPPIYLPEGFRIENLKPGNESKYVQVINLSEWEGMDLKWFFKNFCEDPDYNPQNFFIIYKENEPVAVASAWQTELKNQKIGLLKSVGVIPSYQGKGLGRTICLLALHRLKDRGFNHVLVETLENHISALHLYLNLGFKPLYKDNNDRKLWKKILHDINRSM